MVWSFVVACPAFCTVFFDFACLPVVEEVDLEGFVFVVVFCLSLVCGVVWHCVVFV